MSKAKRVLPEPHEGGIRALAYLTEPVTALAVLSLIRWTLNKEPVSAARMARECGVRKQDAQRLVREWLPCIEAMIQNIGNPNRGTNQAGTALTCLKTITNQTIASEEAPYREPYGNRSGSGERACDL